MTNAIETTERNPVIANSDIELCTSVCFTLETHTRVMYDITI